MKIVHWDTIEVGDFCEVDARKYLHMQILQSGKELNVEDDMWNEIFSVVGGNAGRGEKLVLIDTRRVKYDMPWQESSDHDRSATLSLPLCRYADPNFESTSIHRRQPGLGRRTSKYSCL